MSQETVLVVPFTATDLVFRSAMERRSASLLPLKQADSPT